MKSIKGVIAVVLLLTAVAAAATGNYFVDFAFARCYDQPYNGMPKASSVVVSRDARPAPKPNYPAEDCSISLANGEKRKATLFAAQTAGHDYVILVHGYCRSQAYVWDYAVPYLMAGYNVLTPDLNASGSSDGRYLTMGCVESEDIAAWARELVDRDSQARIILHGVSMGAATVMITTAMDLPENVIAAIEDCGYTSAYDMFAVQLEKVYGLPEFPFMHLINVANRIKTGCYLTAASPIKAVPKTTVPMLFIHGSQDKLVPLSMEEELYRESNAPVKEKIVVEGAGHADSFSMDNDGYFKHVLAFLKNIKRSSM